MIRNRSGFTTVLILFCVLCTLAPGCSDEESSGEKAAPDAADRLNVVLVTLDTLRADHVGAYGSDKVETPAMDRLAEEGSMFVNAVAAAPLTLPSHSSLFTGTYTLTHGVRDNVGFALPEDERTLAEVLKEAGWRTAGFISAYVLNDCFGIAQGFDFYSDEIDFSNDGPISPDSIQRDGQETMDEALSWLEDNRDSPYFLWIHLFDPHTPYAPPEPFLSRYPYDPYAGEVAYTDALVGRLTEKLVALGLLENTIIVLVGDHGEGRGDHKERYHGLFVYDTTIRVPLVFRVPGYPPGKIEAQVRLIDIMPTILDLLGLPLPDRLQGENLEPLLSGEKEELRLAAYSETSFPILHYGWSGVRALRAGKYKYIHAPTPELYDLEADPEERVNIALKEAQLAGKMKKTLLEIEERSLAMFRPGDRSIPVDGRSAEALRLLGYTGTVIARPGDDGDDLADPKDKVDLLLQVSKAERTLSAGNAAEAIQILDAILAEEPGMLDARISLGVALQEIQDYERAVTVLQETTKLAPDLFMVWANLGMALKGSDRHGEALQAFKKAYELDPSNVITMGHMIDAYFRMGRFRKGVDLCKTYLEKDPDSVKVLVAMGMGLVNQGKYANARKRVERAIALDSRAMNAHYILGKSLEGLEEYEGAAEAYEEALVLDATGADLFHSLAGVYQHLEKPEKEIELLRAAVQQFPQDYLSNLMLAKACVREGIQDEQAMASARKAVELNPSSKEAQSILKMIQR